MKTLVLSFVVGVFGFSNAAQAACLNSMARAADDTVLSCSKRVVNLATLSSSAALTSHMAQNFYAIINDIPVTAASTNVPGVIGAAVLALPLGIAQITTCLNNINVYRLEANPTKELYEQLLFEIKQSHPGIFHGTKDAESLEIIRTQLNQGFQSEKYCRQSDYFTWERIKADLAETFASREQTTPSAAAGVR